MVYSLRQALNARLRGRAGTESPARREKSGSPVEVVSSRAAVPARPSTTNLPVDSAALVREAVEDAREGRRPRL